MTWEGCRQVEWLVLNSIRGAQHWEGMYQGGGGSPVTVEPPLTRGPQVQVIRWRHSKQGEIMGLPMKRRKRRKN